MSNRGMFTIRETDNLEGLKPQWISLQRAFEDGDDYEKIAVDHGLPMGTVKSRLARLRATIASRREAAEPNETTSQKVSA